MYGNQPRRSSNLRGTQNPLSLPFRTPATLARDLEARRRGKSSHPDKLPLGLRGSVIINQPEKRTENFISLINAGLDKTAGQIQYRQFLNKGRVNREIAVPRKTFQGKGTNQQKTQPTFEIISRIQT